MPGILAWAVQGCLEWHRDGLRAPEEVRQATSGYRQEMDVLAAFLADRCVQSPSASITVYQLYQIYHSWCEENGEHTLKKRQFSTKLRERGSELNMG
ncbi:MAG: primase-like DNA-binding domain-containing protein [Candidatus Dormibacteraeota bacterium]|nr:primase-like DNA-binding domain-containing protein [Candidatus Dormibacteraeota bacterium]